jgi:hypothetical protein
MQTDISNFPSSTKSYKKLELSHQVSPYSRNRSPFSEGQCTMRNPGIDSRERHRESDDSSHNIPQSTSDGDRSIGEPTRDFEVVEKGHWSSNPSQSLISIFRVQSACSGSHRLNIQTYSEMVCDGRSWKGFRGVDVGKLMVDVHLF